MMEVASLGPFLNKIDRIPQIFNIQLSIVILKRGRQRHGSYTYLPDLR